MIFCARQLQEQACEQQQALFFYYRRYVEFAIIIGYWPVGSGKNKSAETVKKKKRVNGLAPFLLLTYILVFLPRFQFYQCKLFFLTLTCPWYRISLQPLVVMWNDWHDLLCKATPGKGLWTSATTLQLLGHLQGLWQSSPRCGASIVEALDELNSDMNGPDEKGIGKQKHLEYSTC